MKLRSYFASDIDYLATQIIKMLKKNKASTIDNNDLNELCKRLNVVHCHYLTKGYDKILKK